MSYRVAVRALCEFTAKEGDLDLRFTPSPPLRKAWLGTRQWLIGGETAISPSYL